MSPETPVRCSTDRDVVAFMTSLDASSPAGVRAVASRDYAELSQMIRRTGLLRRRYVIYGRHPDLYHAARVAGGWRGSGALRLLLWDEVGTCGARSRHPVVTVHRNHNGDWMVADG